MPQAFFCREHRAIPARGMGPEYCWRCEIRETLWGNLYPRGLAPLSVEVIVLDARPQPGPFVAPARGRKSPGALSNLKPGWRIYVTEPERPEANFAQDFPDDYAHGNWGVIVHWRENVAWR